MSGGDGCSRVSQSNGNGIVRMPAGRGCQNEGHLPCLPQRMGLFTKRFFWYSAGFVLLIFGTLKYLCSKTGLVRVDSPPPGRAEPNMLKIRRDAWQDMSKSELEGLANFFSEKPDRTITEVETIVAEGETVITQGYESAPGAFMFSDLTSRMKTGRMGKPAMFLEARTFEVDINGKIKVYHKTSVEMEGSETIWEIGIGTDTAQHILDVRANQNTDFPMVSIKAKTKTTQTAKR
jgi:hypothetical protein